MTFKDFMLECEMYPHSKEHFDLTKSCIEISLKEQYINDQKFMQENQALVESVSEGYFLESNNTFMEDAIEIEVNFGAIVNGIRKLLIKIGNFFKKVAEKLLKRTNQNEQILGKLSQMAADNNFDPSSIIEMLNSTINNMPFTAPANVKQSYLSDISKIIGEDSPLISKLGDAADLLAIALSDNYVTISLKDTYKNALSADDINNIASHLSTGNISEIDKYLKKETSEININVKPGNIDQISKSIKEAASKIDSIKSIIADNKKSGKTLTEFNETYTKINVTIAKTVNIYSNLLTFRSVVMNRLADMTGVSAVNADSSFSTDKYFANGMTTDDTMRMIVKDICAADIGRTQLDVILNNPKISSKLGKPLKFKAWSQDKWNERYLNALAKSQFEKRFAANVLYHMCDVAAYLHPMKGIKKMLNK